MPQITYTYTGVNAHSNWNLMTKPATLQLLKDNFWDWIGVFKNQVNNFQREDMLTIDVSGID